MRCTAPAVRTSTITQLVPEHIMSIIPPRFPFPFPFPYPFPIAP